MTTISLHPTPARDVVVREQISSVGIALRTAIALFVGALVLFAVLGIGGAIRAAGNPNMHMEASYGAGSAIPMALVAIFLPFGVWRGEDPSRRAYHWAMPVGRGLHTLIKLLSGWVWLMAATVVFVVFIIGVGAVMEYITASQVRVAEIPLWEWAVPFTAATVAYLLSSVVVLASDHPWAWIGGVGIGYIIAIALLKELNMNAAAHALRSVTEGYYGLAAAMFANLETSHFAPPSAARWAASAVVWGALGAAGCAVAAYYRRQA